MIVREGGLFFFFICFVGCSLPGMSKGKCSDSGDMGGSPIGIQRPAPGPDPGADPVKEDHEGPGHNHQGAQKEWEMLDHRFQIPMRLARRRISAIRSSLRS